MLQVKNVNSGYGKLQVLWDITFNVDEGELVAVVG
jgi:branched-chain amino acid transport system ATP-binding protein